MSLLGRILDAKRSEIAELRKRALELGPPPRPVSLRREPGAPLALLAEIKHRSPSAGALSTALTVAERAALYERAGAAMISVLCDAQFFDGAYEHITEARTVTSLPILCKEFVIDEAQLDQARAVGADAVLLIVRCLAPERVEVLVAAARERELEPLVEVVTEQESRAAVDAGATLIGVNARDLDTLEMDRVRAARVLAGLPGHVTSVHLSGLRSVEDVAGVAATPTDAALVGEALMKADDPEPLLRAMVGAARGG